MRRVVNVIQAFVLGAGLMAAAPMGAAEHKIDYKRSSIRFLADARFLNVKGVFRKWSFKGSVPGDLNAKGRLRIVTASLDTKNGTRDKHLRDPDFFHVKKYPYADFVIRSVATKGNITTVSGNFTLRGVTKPMTIKFKKTVRGSALIFTARTWIKRKSFKVDYDSSINPIKDRVRLDFRIVLVKK